MGERSWSFGCRSDVDNYSYSGWGSYLRIWRNGVPGPAIAVSGGVYGKFAEGGRYECYAQPFLGAPVKPYGWVAEANYGRGAWGQWFENGSVVYHDGAWSVMYGRYGQSSLRRSLGALRHPIRRLTQSSVGAEQPPDAPTEEPPTVETWVEKRIATDERF